MINGFFQTLTDNFGELCKLFIDHLNMTTISVMISLLIGVPLGILITKNKRVATVIIGIANVMQSIPSIAFLAFMVPILGIGLKPAIAMVIIYALLPIIKNTYTGISGIDPKILEAARGIGLSRWQQLFKVELPNAAPFIMAGVRIAAVTAVGTVTIAAFAGAGGLGWFINLGLNANNPQQVLLGAIPASLLALAVDFILSRLEQLITPEGLKPADQIVFLKKSTILRRKLVAILLCSLFIVPPVVTGTQKLLDRTSRKITIGTTNFTEVLILGEIYSQLISENTDIKVDERFNLNGTFIASSSLFDGDIDMYVEYSGEIAQNILKLPVDTDSGRVLETITQEMKKRNVTVIPLGFYNSYALAVLPETAKKYGLHTLSDLIAKAPLLRLGCTVEFYQREDLLPSLERDFDVRFKEVHGLQGNIRYQAITNGECEVTDAWTTDAILQKINLTILQDDVNFFAPYDAVNLIRDDTLEKFPELIPLLESLRNALTNDDMSKMNYEVDVAGRSPQDVAHEFLQSRKLI